ncbi:hypothetical protein ACFY36_36245 [Actinoplanes sp. NPDC000266]
MANSVILAITASFMGLSEEESKEFVTRYFWWLFFAAPVILGVLGGAYWGIARWLQTRRDRRRRHQIILAERVMALQHMVREAQEVSRELERYLVDRLTAMETLNARVDEQQQLAGLTTDQVEALDRRLARRFVGERRSGFIQQIVFLVVAFLLGFIVNWLSGPALDVLKGWTS